MPPIQVGRRGASRDRYRIADSFFSRRSGYVLLPWVVRDKILDMPARSRASLSASLPHAITRLFGRRSSIAGPSISRCARLIENQLPTEPSDASETAGRLAVEQYYRAVVAAVTAAMFASWPLDVVFDLLGRCESEPAESGRQSGRHARPDRRFCSEPFVSLGSELSQTPHLRAEIERHLERSGNEALRIEGDLFKDLHHDLFSRSWRHGHGEYYTPDWLARRLLDAVGYRGDSDGRLLDPACGSGTFLCEAVSRLIAGRPSDRIAGNRREVVEQVLHSVAGVDVSPLAVWTARANLLAALRGLIDQAPAELPVFVADSILAPPTTGVFGRPFDFVVGNPPWISWDRLPVGYRNATKPLWSHYGLFSLGAAAARHGGAKKDLSMLMVYVAADRYLPPGGRLAMVLPQIVLQSAGSGDGFRRFVLPDGTKLGVFRVDDYSRVRVFAASNWTCTLCLEKGRPTEFPLEYVRWYPSTAARSGDVQSPSRSERDQIAMGDTEEAADTSAARPTTDAADVALQPVDPAWGGNSPARKPKHGPPTLVAQHCQAAPLRTDSPGAPWIIQSPESAFSLAAFVGKSDYQAHLGANSGGANAIYWLRIVGKAPDGVLVEPVAASKRRRAEKDEMPACAKAGASRESLVIEPDLLYPLVRWGDVDRFSLQRGDAGPFANGTTGGRLAILLVQDPNTRSGISASQLSATCPRCQQYLERHQSTLLRRAAYQRYQAKAPFWSMYNVGPYTISPYKVIWRRMDKIIRAVALGPCRDEYLGEKPFVPQETCVFVACRAMAEAFYLAALLNSEIVGQLASAQSVVGGKGFGTPGMFAQLNIRRFSNDNPRHRRLAFLGGEAHRQPHTCDVVLQEINAIAREEYLANPQIRGRPTRLHD